MEGKINKIASWADSWWKIITILGAIILLIYNLSVIHLTIQENSENINSNHIEIIKEFNIRDSRSDKRYDRAMNSVSELKEYQEHIEEELEKHLIDDAYERGLNDMYKKLH